MKDFKVIYILLIILDVALVGICGFFYLTKDRQPPKISFSDNDTLYYEGINEEDLLKGVGALDKKDNDVSNRVVIEKILYNSDSDQAIVYYAASDYSGNVSKASRVFDTVASKNKLGESVNDTVNDISENSETSIDENEEVDAEADVSSEQDSEETQLEEEQQAENNSEEAKSSEENAVEQAAASEQAAAIKELEEAQKRYEEQGCPYIELSYGEYRIKKGENVPWQEVIRTLKDDLEDYNYLFNKLVASEFDKHSVGVYPVKLFTTDKSGNKSNVVSVNIIVE